MTALTANQRAALRFIHGHIRERGWSPSVREVQEHLGLRSCGHVMDNILAPLSEDGYLDWRPRSSRSFQTLKPPVEHHVIAGCPSCGDVIAPEGVCPGCGQTLGRAA